jgi:formylglycine-generating enzyme required for sulfatase activity
MGSPDDEPGRYCGETQHKVTLTKGFLFGIHLVTQEQWQMVIGDIPAYACGGEPNRPVEEVSWDDCQEFLKRLTEMEGKTYRLPTEAEWEYACRAGTTTPFYCGETISTVQGDYRIDYRQGTRPVSSLPANAFGLYDMHGFVWEWCSDWYDGGYPKREVVDPEGPANGDGRVMRGGTYPDIAGLGSLVRSAHRINDDPDKRTYWYGFRAARTITGTI